MQIIKMQTVVAYVGETKAAGWLAQQVGKEDSVKSATLDRSLS